MKDFFDNLTSELRKCEDLEFVYRHSKINWIFTNVWNVDVVLTHQDVELIKLGRHCSIFLVEDTFVIKKYGKEIMKSGKLIFEEQTKINISFSFQEGIIRVIGTGLTDGTWKNNPLDLKAIPFIAFNNDKTKPYVYSIGAHGKFFQVANSLKNISGLKLWLKTDNPYELHPGTNKIKVWKDNSGNSNHLIQNNVDLAPELDGKENVAIFNPGNTLECFHNNFELDKTSELTILTIFEMANFVFKEKEQRLLSLTLSDKESIELILQKEQEEIGKYPNLEMVTRIFCNHTFTVENKSFKNENFIDLFTSFKFLDKTISNETPGPEIFFLTYQSVKDNKIFMKDFNYHKDKWFSLSEINQPFSHVTKKEQKESLKISPDGKFQGKIKEIFIFDRLFYNLEQDNNENWILLYLKQKYKLNDIKFILDKKQNEKEKEKTT